VLRLQYTSDTRNFKKSVSRCIIVAFLSFGPMFDKNENRFWESYKYHKIIRFFRPLSPTEFQEKIWNMYCCGCDV
jgi:hypothetical protein